MTLMSCPISGLEIRTAWAFAFDLEDDRFEFAQRREPHPTRGVVRQRRGSVFLPEIELDQVLRTCSHERADPYVAFGVERVEVFRQPSASGVNREFGDRNVDALVHGGRPSCAEDLDRVDELPAAERWPGRTVTKQRIVHTVMQDDAKALAIEAAEADAERLGQGVTNAVRVSEALHLDDLRVRRTPDDRRKLDHG
jgi:hypothetical protein